MPSESLHLAPRPTLREPALGAQMLRGVLADALKEVEALVGKLAHEALVDEPLHDVNNRGSAPVPIRTDNRARRFEREASVKHRKPGKRRLLGFAQQFP